MPLDPSYAGRTYPPTAAYQVGREKIREFALAIGADDAAYHDPDAARALGYPDVVAPPTFPVVVTASATRQLIDDPGLGLDFSRVVHADQRFAYVRPVVAGDELVCVNTIEEITSRGGHDFLSTRTEVTTVAGAPVVTAWCRLVVRGEA
ncbi:MAG: MaoC family dehydratase N-terminal domain-containing protein [Micromonosporaceae bacterium]|jgi:acyl dehydratase|nr:MaoC family dehydratase N-terminal domain-containing protein [Micromonosporaceae bacterium]